ncbi:PPC domain-containing protein [Cellulomonas sp. ATA003]|uniref:PPC domain-containing protein n=1 Tax=Cellulomonas sp. ATA003 TaxID=3073064 RepID=UPI002872CA0E|nr:PPC domain-containing protein [Cellulomonas sp. ATA003]WNB86515.1 PPC domain-containing protein [Cellulomonas sp. ATA003]
MPKGSADQRRAPGMVEPNPYLSLLPDPSAIDRHAWKARSAAGSAAREESRSAVPDARTEQQRTGGRRGATPLVVQEAEPGSAWGVNDTPATAEPVPGFGSRRREASAADIRGTLSSGPAPVPFASPPEDNGSIPLAGATGVSAGTAMRTTGTIGDGPHGSAGDATGDLDFYAVPVVAGQRLVVDTDTAGDGLDTVVIVWDATGVVIASNDDDGSGGFDSSLSVPVPATGDLYVSVSAYGSYPTDPFDSASGSGATSEGDYAVTFALDATDVDVYAVRLRPGTS